MQSARDLAELFTIEQLRAAFDSIDIEIHAFRQHDEITVEIDGTPVVTTAATVGDAKLIKRGWI